MSWCMVIEMASFAPSLIYSGLLYMLSSRLLAPILPTANDPKTTVGLFWD